MNEMLVAAQQPRELIAQALEWLESGHQIALLTLINIEGNAPYPVGSQMLVNENNEYLGQITGGCAETALAHQAAEAIRGRKNSVERYGLNSKYFDIQLPCGSGIDVHFDVQLSISEFETIQRELTARQAVDWPIKHEHWSFRKRYLPNERLLIFGQGPIKLALENLAIQCGFDVVSFDADTPTSFSRDCLPYCDRYSALVSLFHEHDFEIDIFQAALTTELFYFGALGSKRTHSARLHALGEKAVSQSLCEKIHGPVGLDIGAVSPSQIAISILSQLIAKMNQDGRFSS